MEFSEIYDNKEEYYPFVIKKIHDKFFLYNLVTNGIFLLDDDAYNVFIKKDNLYKKKYEKLLCFLKENFILKTKENNEKLDKIYKDISNKKKTFAPTGLTLMVSQECNLKCKYCYGDGGEYCNRGKMDFSTAKKAINYLIKIAPTNKIGICFFGGEPLMNLKLIKDVLNYTKELKKTINKQFHFSMTTNGTLVTQEIKNIIKKYRISLTISLDGKREMNDANRYYPNGRGVYNTIKNNIKNLSDDLVVRATLAPPNLNIKESINHLIKDLKINEVAWAEADNLLTEEDFDLLKDSYYNLIEELREYILEKRYNEVKKYHMFLNTLKKFSTDGIRIKGCGAGNNMIAIGIDGKVYPCHRFVGIEKYVLNDVNNIKEINNDFFNNVDLINFRECDYCIARNICGGACVNENFYATGNINTPSKKHCNYTKSIVEKLLEIYLTLDEKDKEYLFS